MNNYYAGIGSRETPQDVCAFFKKLGAYLANHNFTLRSGGAQGADKAFEIGCNKVNGDKEIYLPWKGFEGSNSTLYKDNPEAYIVAEKHHPYWYNLSEGARKLQARNSHQVLGEDLKTPSSFVLCWAKNGSGQGGTGQAIRIAKAYDIPIFDAGKYKDMDEIKNGCKKFLDQFIGG